MTERWDDLMSEDEARTHLSERIATCGGLRVFARAHRLDPGNLSRVASGQSPITPRIATALGLRRVTVFERHYRNQYK